MPLQTIEPRRLYRQIADQLRGLMESREYAVGSRLPPERDLASQLGVSRPSVREALIALEVEGRVEVRGGSGVYVRVPEPGALARSTVAAESPFETLRARGLVEGELAALAAREADPALVTALRHAVAVMRGDVAAGRSAMRGDRRFHLRLAEASGNSVLLRVVTELFDERHNPLSQQLGSHFETAQSWAAAVEEHAAVVEAIAAGAPDVAREAMARHLARSHDRFTAAWPARPSMPAAAPPSRSPAASRRRTPSFVRTEHAP